MKLSREKYRILKELDVHSARYHFSQYKALDGASSIERDELILSGLHKARLMLPRFFNAMELASSRQWLIDHGHKP